jgi:hypothetical protein
MMLNKKAQSAEALVMAFGGLVIVVLIIALTIMVQNNTAKGHMEDAVNKVDNSITLLNYLRTPADTEHTMADMIAEYRMTKSTALKDNIAARSRQIFGSMPAGIYGITIKLDDEKMAEMKKTCSKVGTVSQDIMLFDGNKAKVELICG